MSRVLVLTISAVMCGTVHASPTPLEDRTYPLGDCAHVGFPPVIKMTKGTYKFPLNGGVNEIELVSSMLGELNNNKEKFDLVQLACSLDGANTVTTEYFLFNSSGVLVDRLDESRIKYDYLQYLNTLTNSDTDTDYRSGQEDVSFNGGDLVVKSMLGGYPGDAKWVVTTRYKLNKSSILEVRETPTISLSNNVSN